ncbi:hypothetical protein niasHT_013871 [Heterodera trifolii]|uniref:Uncharacterized protein n=1 Tax=Heterodera trifolii TaxID=157864 RepID=A0ABD2L3B9_9BILA
MCKANITDEEFESGVSFLCTALGSRMGESQFIRRSKTARNRLGSTQMKERLFANVYLPKSMPRANDLAFATTACDSLLITAQFSSFSWWIAYLMPDNATIFYNSKITKNVYTTNENFLAEWVPIELVNGKIMLSNGTTNGCFNCQNNSFLIVLLMCIIFQLITVHLTNGGGGFKKVQFCPLAQCHAANDGPNEIAKMP